MGKKEDNLAHVAMQAFFTLGGSWTFLQASHCVRHFPSRSTKKCAVLKTVELGDTLAVFRRLAFSLQLGKVPFQGSPKRGYLNTALSPADPVIMSQFIFKKPVIFKILLQCSIRAVVFLHRVCHTGLKRANHIRCFFQSRACRQPPTVLCVWYACRVVPLAKRTDCAAKRYVGAIC